MERALLQIVRALGVGGLSHEEWRSFFHERRGRQQGYKRNTIDGDLIEKFLDLNQSTMEMVTKYVNDELTHLSRQGPEESEGLTGGSGKREEPMEIGIDGDKFSVLTVKEIVQRVEDLSRLH